jgi:hypothetical protein
MQPEKKQLEILLINYFRESFTDFPKGRIIPSESPDFIIKLKSRNHLGIELTRLNPGNAKVPDQPGIAQIELRENIIDTAKSLFENSSPLKLFVKFLFSEKHPVSHEKKLITAVHAVNRIRRSVENIKPGRFFSEIISDDNPGNELQKILIVSHPSLKSSIWERSNNLGISENITADILTSVKKKEEKLSLYQKQRLNYYWLIITSDQLRGLNNYKLTEITGSNTFNSHFQHIFLFDIITSKVYQLL